MRRIDLLKGGVISSASIMQREALYVPATGFRYFLFFSLCEPKLTFINVNIIMLSIKPVCPYVHTVSESKLLSSGKRIRLQQEKKQTRRNRSEMQQDVIEARCKYINRYRDSDDEAS